MSAGGARASPGAPVVTTSRLELRPFALEDGEPLHALFTDPGVRRWLLDDALVAREWLDGEIAESERRFAAGGCGLWVIREPPVDSIVGFAGFRPFWDPPQLELVYALHPSVWGRGLATEAAGAAMAYGFDTLGFTEVLAATDVPNTASVAVLSRLGFEEYGRTGDGPAGTIRFRIDAARWRSLTGPR